MQPGISFTGCSIQSPWWSVLCWPWAEEIKGSALCVIGLSWRRLSLTLSSSHSLFHFTVNLLPGISRSLTHCWQYSKRQLTDISTIFNTTQWSRSKFSCRKVDLWLQQHTTNPDLLKLTQKRNLFIPNQIYNYKCYLHDRAEPWRTE